MLPHLLGHKGGNKNEIDKVTITPMKLEHGLRFYFLFICVFFFACFQPLNHVTSDDNGGAVGLEEINSNEGACRPCINLHFTQTNEMKMLPR